jgi:outer membrane immunogenic protein
MSTVRDAWLVAGASSVVLAGAAEAQSQPAASVVKATWAGFYAGVNLGQARHYASTADVDGYSGIPPANYVTTWFDSSRKSFSYGGQVGYSWHHQILVGGIEADISHVGAKTTVAPALGPGAIGVCEATCFASATNELKWLATFRARGGIAYERFLVYATAGLALGRVANRWGFGDSNLAGSFSDSQFAIEETRRGVVYGGGVEYAAWGPWIVRVEGLYVNFGTTSQTISTPNARSFGTGPFRTDFKNTVTVGRFALNYKW